MMRLGTMSLTRSAGSAKLTPLPRPCVTVQGSSRGVQLVKKR
jgi:hypothetical protein